MLPYGIAPNRVACATNNADKVHVLFTDQQDLTAGKLWHTIFDPEVVDPNSAWESALGDVLEVINANAARAGRPQVANVGRVSCAFGAAYQLHVCVVDGAGKLWHTIRGDNGDWYQYGFGDVQSETSKNGPDVGRIIEVTCSANESGDLHICVLNSAGRLYHTIRSADGTWPDEFGDVLQAVAAEGEVTFQSPITRIACACSLSNLQVWDAHAFQITRDVLGSEPLAPNRFGTPSPAQAPLDDDLHITLVSDNTIWYTARRGADGSWPHDWENIQALLSAVAPRGGTLLNETSTTLGVHRIGRELNALAIGSTSAPARRRVDRARSGTQSPSLTAARQTGSRTLGPHCTETSRQQLNRTWVPRLLMFRAARTPMAT